jgi:hypothetical protein
MTDSGGIATTIGNFFPVTQTPLLKLDEYSSIIYNDSSGKHDGLPCGETNDAAGESTRRRKSKVWVTNPRSRIRRSTNRGKPRLIAPTR